MSLSAANIDSVELSSIAPPTNRPGEEDWCIEATQQAIKNLQEGLQGHVQKVNAPNAVKSKSTKEKFALIPKAWPASSELSHSLEMLCTVAEADFKTHPVYNSVVKELAKTKTAWLNHMALCKPLAFQTHGLTRPSELAKADTPDWLAAWHQQALELTPMINALHERLGSNVATVIHRWLALSAPVLYAWNYPDSATHAGQVAQLCYHISKKQDQSPLQQLQALLVGLIHDPKFDPTLSTANVATHPLVAASLASLWFNDNELSKALNGLFKSGEERHQWEQGLMAALTINNDSRYVTEQEIAPALRHQLSLSGDAEVEDLFYRRLMGRLTAPSHGAPLPEVEDSLQDALRHTQMESGLIGIQPAVWDKLLHDENAPTDLYEQICAGNVNADTLAHWHELLQNSLHHDPDTLTHWTVNGLALLAHHQGILLEGQPAALCLAFSDPLLLSPHKILQARRSSESILEGIKSYVQSFRENLASLPMVPAKHPLAPVGAQWHKALLQVLTQTAQALTFETIAADGGDPQHTNEHYSWGTLLKDTTWGFWGTRTKDNDPQTFKHVYTVLEKKYQALTQPLLRDPVKKTSRY